MIKLGILPLSYWFEFLDICFLIKSMKDPSDNFDIYNYITFTSSSTRSASKNNLSYNYSRTCINRHFYFNRIVKLWNSLPPIDVTLSLSTIKHHIYTHLWNHFITHYDITLSCSLHFVIIIIIITSNYHFQIYFI